MFGVEMLKWLLAAGLGGVLRLAGASCASGSGGLGQERGFCCVEFWLECSEGRVEGATSGRPSVSVVSWLLLAVSAVAAGGPGA